MVAEGDLAAAVIIPSGYSKAILADKSARLIVIADTSTIRLDNHRSGTLETCQPAGRRGPHGHHHGRCWTGERIPFKYGFEQTLEAWDDPPIAIVETTSSAVTDADEGVEALSHTAPGMMLQFAIAGLLTCATVIVNERKSRTLQRMLTTNTRRIQILLGHYLAIFLLIFIQFTILIAFGQFILKVNYLRVPDATFLVAFSAALCIAALGLLIGVLARSEEQAVTFSLIPMFVFSGLGGAWVPLELTGETFAAIGHISPVAWAMDGFKNIIIRGFGLESVLVPAAALAGYAALFFILAVWRLSAAEEK